MGPEVAASHTWGMKSILVTMAMAVGLQAGSIQLTGVGYGRPDVEIVNPNGQARDVYATEIYVTREGSSYIAYCVDLFPTIGFNTYQSSTGTPDSYLNGGRAAWLFETYAGLVRSNDDAAALQVAMWDVVHDTGDGLGMGVIRLGTSETALGMAANLLVASSLGRSSMNAAILYNFELGTGQQRQTLISYGLTPPPTGVETPEPATMLLIGAGLAGVFAISRRGSGTRT